jgi:broad-specificity NMP kinase
VTGSRHGPDGLDALAGLIAERGRGAARPVVVAIDGRSGSGKTTLAAALADRLGAAVVDGDAFYAGGVAVRGDAAAERAAACIDWTRQRAVLEALRAGRPAAFRAFDWDAFDGRLETGPTRIDSAAVVIIEGVYAARPELADLIDLRVLLRIDEPTRLARLEAREGGVGPWERQWLEAEDHYFGRVLPEGWFDHVAGRHAAEGDGGPR